MKIFLAILAVLIGEAAAPAQEPYSQLRKGGPLTLAIEYKCNPDARLALRQHMLNTGLKKFDRWKAEGVLKDYRILFNSYLDSDTFEMLALLSFGQYSDVGRWREIEKASPGGLAADGLKLISSAVTYSLDLVRQGASSKKPVRGKSVFFIIPYDYDPTPPDDYVKYLDGYVIPQVGGWMKEDVLASYNIYLSRYSTSRPWGSLFVLEYRDSDAFGLREATVTTVRETLQNNPVWKGWSDTKHKIRIEKKTVVAEELLLP